MMQEKIETRPLSALSLAQAIEAGQLSPRDVLELCAKAIARDEKTIGAFAALDLEKARRSAQGPLAARPLRGLPVGIKDIFDTTALPTAYGSAIYAGHTPASDAAIVVLVRRAGGILLGKTVTTEFASLQPAATRNPRNLAHTPGGSSSGSAAAVAAGMVPIAFGSQTGGSVIRPAAFCGVAGYKPSFRMLPTIGMKCFSWSLDTVGLFAASVADVAFAAAATSGRDLRVDGRDIAAPVIALARTPAWHEASADMQRAIEHALRKAENAGAKIEEFAWPALFDEAIDAHPTVQDFEAHQALAYEFDTHRDRLSLLLQEQLDKAAAIRPDAYDAARRTARRARRTFADLMSRIDVLLTPSAPGAAPAGLGSTGKPTFNRLWTLLGAPCINVPGLFDNWALPLGIQVVGRFARDKRALEAAAFLEQAL